MIWLGGFNGSKLARLGRFYGIPGIVWLARFFRVIWYGCLVGWSIYRMVRESGREKGAWLGLKPSKYPVFEASDNVNKQIQSQIF